MKSRLLHSHTGTKVHRGKVVSISFLMVAIFVATISVEGSPQLPKEIQASEIIAKIINNETVSYHEVVINGSLDLRSTEFPKEHIDRSDFQIKEHSLRENRSIIRPNITIKMSEIRGNLNFSNTRFEGNVDFEGTKVSGEADLRGSEFGEHVTFKGASLAKTTLSFSEFLKEAHFENAIFGNYADFTMSKFHQAASFKGTQFLGVADFEDALFQGDAIFDKVRFNSQALFTNAKFDKKARFIQAQFNEESSYNNATFEGFADFLAAHFVGKTKFISANFYDVVRFLEAEFDEDTSFLEANFTDIASFEKSRFERVVDFGQTRFGSGADFALAQFIGDALFEDASFDKSLNLTRTKFNKFYISWSSIKEPIIYDGATYLALIKNYRDMERFDESNQCYYDYRSKSPDKGPWDYLEWGFYGFGVVPWIPAAWSLFIILICGSLFLIGDGIRKWTYFETADGPDPDVKKIALRKDNLSLFDPYLFSLSEFTSGAASFIHPNTKLKPLIGRYTSLALIERLFGSLFIALFIAALTKTYLFR